MTNMRRSPYQNKASQYFKYQPASVHEYVKLEKQETNLLFFAFAHDQKPLDSCSHFSIRL